MSKDSRSQISPGGRHRTEVSTIVRNLGRLMPFWWRRRLEVTPETALLAGCVDLLGGAVATAQDPLATTVLIMGEDYVAGFRDGFTCGESTRRATRRYVEGLDDGGIAGQAIRHTPEGHIVRDPRLRVPLSYEPS